MMRPATLKVQTSSGGVIFRREKDLIEIVMITVKNGTTKTIPLQQVAKENWEKTAENKLVLDEIKQRLIENEKQIKKNKKKWEMDMLLGGIEG